MASTKQVSNRPNELLKRQDRFSISNADLIVLIIISVSAFAIAAYTSYVPQTTGVKARLDWQQFIQQGVLLNIVAFVAAEMVSIRAGLISLENEIKNNTRSVSLFRFESDIYTSFNHKLIRMLDHQDQIVRTIVPRSTKSFFDTIKVDQSHIELSSDYFGAQVCVEFMGAVKDIQVGDNADKIIIRASHSADLDVWRGRDDLLAIQSEFHIAGGELYRIMIKNTDSVDNYEAYDAVIRSMAATKVTVFFYDLTKKEADFHDYLLCNIDSRFYSMKWKWYNR